MALVHKHSCAVRQPAGLVKLNKSHRFCPQVGVWLGGRLGFNLIDGKITTQSGANHATDIDSAGIYSRTTVTNSYWSAGDLSTKFNGAGTVLMLLRAGSIGSTNENFPINCGGGQEYPYVGDNNIYCGIFAAGRWINGVAPVVDIASTHWLVVQAETNNFRLSQNNQTVATSGATTFTAPTAIDLLGTGSVCFTRGAYFIGVDNRRWSDDEVAEFIENPWQIFKQAGTPKWYRSQWINGDITESLNITDWRITATSCLDGSKQGTAISTGATYSVECDSIVPCTVTAAPHFDYAWSVGKVVELDDLVIPTDTESTPRLYKAIDIGSSPHQTHATTEPTWPTSGTVVDNDITWTFVSDLPTPRALGPKIPS